MLMYDVETDTYSKIIKRENIATEVEKITNVINRLSKQECLDDLPILFYEDLDWDNKNSIEYFMYMNTLTPTISYNRFGECVFLTACFFSSKKEIIKWLVEIKGAEVNKVNILGKGALIHLITNNVMPLNDKLEVIQFLIDYGLDVNQMNLNNKTALTTAMDMMESEIANLLIDNGARIFKNINVYDKLHDFHSVNEPT